MKTFIIACGLALVSTTASAQADLVSRVKDALVLQGQTFTTNCDSFEITRRVAWLLRAEGAQLVGKSPAQNGCEFGGVKYSHDAIAFPTGWRDILISAGPPANTNTPTWDLTGTDPNAPLYAPFPYDAPAPPVVTPTPPVVVVPDLTLLQQLVIELQKAQLDSTAAIRADIAALREDGISMRDTFTFIAKYIAPALGTLLAALKLR